MDAPLPSPSGTSIRSNKPSVPLLSLAPPALALGDELAVGEPGDDNNAGEIWNVITRAADLVKDGERLENLAWRHWGQPRRNIQETTRRLSMSSQATSASSASIHTPIENSSNVPFLHRTRSAERLTFGGALKLLLEKDENNFKDWIEDAKKHSYSLPIHPPPPPPTISVPDTPIANVEIRLVEPTPVPSRVGSLGGSMSTSGLLHSTTTVPPALKEDVIGEERATIASTPVEKERETERYVRIASSSTPIGTPRRSSKLNSPKKKNSKFFVQSSPSKGSGSDSSHPSHHSPTVPTTMKNNNLNNNGAGPSLPSTLLPSPKHGRRRSSGDSSSGKSKLPEINNHSNNHAHGQPHPHGHAHGHQKRHVSLSTMRGKYHAEKRRMAEQHSAMTAAAENDNKDNEGSGWEDEEEDMGEDDDEDGNWSDEEDSPKVEKIDKDKAPHQDTSEVSEKEQHKVNNNQQQKPSLNRRTSSSKSHSRITAAPKMGRTTSDDHHGQDLLTLLTSKSGNRRSSQGHSGKEKDAPPPPAPTPLTKMSKKERQKAAAERAKIEAELEAQRQREMFAKQQIFGSRHNQGLLASALQRGASMVNLQTATDGHSIRPSPTHGQLPSLASSPAPGPALLRSKSVVAMPVQTGVSVTIPPHALNPAKVKKAQKNSQEKAKASVELESSCDEESDADADYLNTTQTKQKLAALAAKRDAKTQNQVQSKAQAHSQSPNQSTNSNAQQQQQQQPLTQALPAGPRVNEFGYVQPMTPTTRRRNIIMAEMSESLRRNVVLEREKSSGGGTRALGLVRPPPSTHTSKLPTHRSAINLTQYSRGGGGGETMERTSSHPARASPNTSQPSSHTGAITTLPPPPPSTSQTSMPPPPPPTLEGSRRRTTPNILGGGNFLRPLTRATTAQPPPPLQPPPKSQSQVQSNFSQSRNSSTTNFTTIDPGSQRSESPSSMNMEAPAMMRRSTEGDDLHRERERRRELARRRDTTDTSYRLHGW